MSGNKKTIIMVTAAVAVCALLGAAWTAGFHAKCEAAAANAGSPAPPPPSSDQKSADKHHPAGEPDEITFSPQRTFQIEHCFNPDTSNYQWRHWIRDRKTPNRRVLLYESDDAVETLVSPDDAWIAINDRLGSTDRITLLFRKSKEFGATELKNVGLRDLAFRTAAAQAHFSPSQIFDHQYCEALCWLGSHKLVLHAWGYMSGENADLRDWFGIYDVKSGKMEYDLATINQGVFKGKIVSPKPATPSH